MVKITKIVSGGQTGVDQAALRAAAKCGITTGGWCPPKRECESGVIPPHFPLTETPEERSQKAPDVPRSLRTEWNVRDSDATLILRPNVTQRDDPGTEWTGRCAAYYGKPFLVCDPFDHKAVSCISNWLNAISIVTLNIAGPSESTQPGIGDKVYELLINLFSSSDHFDTSTTDPNSSSRSHNVETEPVPIIYTMSWNGP